MIEGVLTNVLMPCKFAHDEDMVVEWIEENHNLRLGDDFELICDAHPDGHEIYQFSSYRDAADIEERVDQVKVFMTTEAFTRYKLGKDIIEEKYNLQPGDWWYEDLKNIP